MVDEPVASKMSKDPERDSDFARGKQAAQDAGVLPGVDPVTKEIGGLTYRLLFNMMNGDADAAKAKFLQIARLGGYGDVGLNQTLDIKSIEGAKDDSRILLERGVDRQGLPLDLYGRRQIEQQIQFHDNVLNEVRQALADIEKG